MRSVCMIGLGYIGLPTATVMASRGLKVIGVDINVDAVNMINNGQVPIVEPDLDVLLREVVSTGNLVAKLTPETADVFVIAVPTPFKQDKTADLRYIRAAIESVAPCLEKNNLLILESTSPVGTTNKIVSWLKELRPDLVMPVEDSEHGSDINIAYCPERVLPGKILQELIGNDRVIGGFTPGCAAKAVEFYKIFVNGNCYATKARVAAMCKLTENAYRDVNIAFANELSMICDDLNIDVSELRELANRHPRVDILKPGCGVGGHCIAVDPWFIVDAAPKKAKLIKQARETNDAKPYYVADKILHDLAADAKSILFLGLSYKENIGDLRESPAVEIVKNIAERRQDLQIYVCEPHIAALPSTLLNCKNVHLEKLDAISVLEVAAVIPLVNHLCFANIPLEVELAIL